MPGSNSSDFIQLLMYKNQLNRALSLWLLDGFLLAEAVRPPRQCLREGPKSLPARFIRRYQANLAW